MNRILFHKEWRQHGAWFFLLLGLSAGLFFLAAFASNADGTGAGAFYGIGNAYKFVLPLSCLILGNLLVATEFRLNTQLFLEGLPLPRWRMLTVKFALAYFLAIACAWLGIGVGALIANGTEAITPRFLAILATSATLWATFVMGLFLVIGFLGRYRIAICLTLYLTFNLLITSSRVPVGDFPPFKLVNFFGFERETWPMMPMIWTGIISFAWLILAYVMGLAKEGSIASMLGEKMSYREKMVIGGTIASVVLAATIFQLPKPAPFSLPGAVSEEWEGCRIYISPEEQDAPVDLEVALARRLGETISARRDWLGIAPEDFPPIYLVERTDLDPPGVLPIYQDKDRICLLYADYRHDEFSETHLVSEALSLALSTYTWDRSRRDNRWWITRGLLHFWEGEADFAEIDESLSVDQLLKWKAYHEDRSEAGSDEIAGSLIAFIESTYGDEALQKLVRNTITLQVTRKDSRPAWWEIFHPVPRAVKSATGDSLATVLDRWKTTPNSETTN